MPLAAVVILFYPNNEELVKNLSSYSRFVDHLYIVDNTPSDSVDYEDKIEKLGGSKTYLKNEKNLGIAASLNKAVSLACKQGYSWLLTMDHDSFFEEGEIINYLAFFKKHFYDKKDVAIVCPQSEPGIIKAKMNDDYEEVIKAITSGSLINISICEKLEGFDEKLFIDEVDFEYCYRCVINGYRLFQFKNIHLSHQLGVKKEAGYFSFINKSKRVLHSPVRVYYMVRNHFYVSSKYAKHFPEEMRERRKQLLVTIKNNLLFSGQALKVVASVIKGYFHYKQNRFS